MMNNTVVTASDHNYIWGVYLMIASMRRNSMPEPVLVLGFGYTAEDKAALESLGGVTVIDGGSSRRSLTCSKPDAMCLAETEYISWVDCDSFFIGNCSDRLLWEDPELIHIRRRSIAENCNVFRKIACDGPIPEPIFDVWRRDVGERETPRFDTCCSACYLSLHRRHLPFLKRWSDQMAKVLPEGDAGVVDTRSAAYFQTDESVLNSLLCFMEEAPEVAPYYKLDKDRSALYVHFISRPKPWVCWTPHSLRFFREYTALVDWAKAGNYRLPGPVPLALRSDCRRINWLRSRLSVPLRKFRTLRKRLGI